MLISSPAFSNASPDGGINNKDVSSVTEQRVSVVANSLESRVLREFNKTTLRTRIVKIKIKRNNKKTKIYLTWHPRKAEDVPDDIFLIVKTINKTLPQFDSIFLEAIHPAYMRWSKYVFWDGVITKKFTSLNRHSPSRPELLY